MLLRGNSPELRVLQLFWEKSEAPLPLPKRGCNFIHPKQLGPFPVRSELPIPDGEIPPGHEEDVFLYVTVLLRG